MVEAETPDFLAELLGNESLWQLAAPLIRQRMAEVGQQQKYVQNIFRADQATVSRFLNGKLPPRLAAKPDKLFQLLTKLEMDPDHLEAAIALWLCANPECASQYFHPLHNRAVAFPQLRMKPTGGNHCPLCGEPMVLHCSCSARVVKGSHCPACGLSYVNGLPKELEGLRGDRLIRRCQERNQRNVEAREHADSE